MPKTPIDYSKAIIYSIVCKTDETLIYVGSTTNFRERKYSHKGVCINENDKKHNLQVYVMIRANGGWDSFEMTPIKEFPCKNKVQLVIEEERIRKEMNANLNTRRAFLSLEERMEEYNEYNKQYRKENADSIAKNGKIYREANTAKIAEDNKKYREANVAKIAENNKKYQKANPAKIAETKKQYYEKNKQQIAEARKQHYEKNKQQINERRKIKRQELKNAL